MLRNNQRAGSVYKWLAIGFAYLLLVLLVAGIWYFTLVACKNRSDYMLLLTPISLTGLLGAALIALIMERRGG